MATTTSNLGLVKPTEAEYALVTELNANSDKIDAEVGKERSNFALVQNGDTATQAISQGQLVVWKGVLKKASANIANGATLSSSNLTDDSIAAELASLNGNKVTYDLSDKAYQSGSLNDLPQGVWRIYATATEKPVSDNGYCSCIERDADNKYQVFVATGNKVYIRMKSVGSWGRWEQYALNIKIEKHSIPDTEIEVPAQSYNVEELAIVDSAFSNMIANGYLPFQAQVNGDSLALDVSVQNFSSKWYLVARNWYTIDQTLRNVLIWYIKE